MIYKYRTLQTFGPVSVYAGSCHVKAGLRFVVGIEFAGMFGGVGERIGFTGLPGELSHLGKLLRYVARTMEKDRLREYLFEQVRPAWQSRGERAAVVAASVVLAEQKGL